MSKKLKASNVGHVCYFCAAKLSTEEVTLVEITTAPAKHAKPTSQEVECCEVCALAQTDNARGPHLQIGSGLVIAYPEMWQPFFGVVISISADRTTYEVAITQDMMACRVTVETLARDSVKNPWWAVNGDHPTVVGVTRKSDPRLSHRIMRTYVRDGVSV